MNINKHLKILIIFLIIFAWIYSGFPRLWQNPPIPPKIQEAQAAWGVPKIGNLVEVDGTTVGNITLVEPAGITQGDLMLACIGYRGSEPFSLPSGWGLVATQQSSGDVDATNGIASGVMAYIVRGASAPDLTFTRTVLANAVAQGRIIAYSGGSATPYDTGSANTLAVAAFDVTTASITTAEAGELIVAMVSVGDNDNTSAFDAATDPTTASGATDTITAPTAGTWIERSDTITATGADHGLAIADAIRATAGITGIIQATVADDSRNVMIAGAFKIVPPTTILGNSASEPSSVTIGPGDPITDLDNFTLNTNTSTDTVTAAVVTLGPANAYNNIAQVDITDTSNVAKCTAVTGLTSNTVTFSSCTISVTTAETTYKVRITPKSHASMPPPSSGASYDTTGTVTSYTSTNVQTGSDTGSATITVDNLSPNGATATSTSAGNEQVTLNWTTSNSSDFSRSVVLRWTGASPGSEVPAEGTDYSVDNTITTATVACVRTTDATSTAVSGTDGAGTGGCSAVALTNGQAYSYKVFQKDSNGNYDIGVSMGSATPAAATVSCSTNIATTSFGTWTDTSIKTASPNASTTMSCSNTSAGCILYVKDANAGLATTSPAYTIPSPWATTTDATGTVADGSEGYGIQATTTSAGLTIAPRYLQTGNTVGGLKLTNTTVASSTADISNAEVIVTHKAAVSETTPAGSYSDTITYECVVN